MNGQVAKPNRIVRPGDQIEISRPYGRKQLIRVREVADHHVPKADARNFYEDLTPPPTAEEIEMRRMDRVYRAAMTQPGAPDKRARRAMRKMKGKI